MTQQIDRELGCDDEIEKSGGDWVLLPEGEYNFEVTKFDRGRHPGSANLPPCNKATITLKVDGGEHGEATVTHNLFLHTKTEGFLSNFFEGIGHKKEGERVRMNWNAVLGAKGRCVLEINKYTGNDGKEYTSNQVKTFLTYEKYLEHAGQSQQPMQQAQPQQQMNQAPFPTGQPQQQTNTGFTQGRF